MAILGTNTSTELKSVSSESQPVLADLGEFSGDPDFVLSLARGLRVIEAFQGHSEGQSIADISRRTRLSRAAVRRLLMTLERLGYAEESGHGGYRLTPNVLKLGFSYLSSAPLPALAQPELEKITERLRESSSLSVREGDEIVYIARASSKRIMSVELSVGSHLPAYCTSMGRVLLSALTEDELSAYLRDAEVKALTSKTITDKNALGEVIRRVRSDQFALTDEELELGLRSIAVPVRNRRGTIVAAMNIGAQAARVSSEEMVQRFLPILQEASRNISQLLV